MSITIKGCLDFGKGFWNGNHLTRGKKLDQLRGQNIPHNSKAIDKTVDLNCIISHKSTDIRSKSYANPEILYYLGNRFVNQLAAYKGEVRRNHKIWATYHLHWATENPDCKRILEWFIPSIILSERIEVVLTEVIKNASQRNIEVDIYTILDY